MSPKTKALAVASAVLGIFAFAVRPRITPDANANANANPNPRPPVSVVRDVLIALNMRGDTIARVGNVVRLTGGVAPFTGQAPVPTNGYVLDDPQNVTEDQNDVPNVPSFRLVRPGTFTLRRYTNGQHDGDVRVAAVPADVA